MCVCIPWTKMMHVVVWQENKLLFCIIEASFDDLGAPDSNKSEFPASDHFWNYPTLTRSTGRHVANVPHLRTAYRSLWILFGRSSVPNRFRSSFLIDSFEKPRTVHRSFTTYFRMDMRRSRCTRSLLLVVLLYSE